MATAPSLVATTPIVGTSLTEENDDDEEEEQPDKEEQEEGQEEQDNDDEDLYTKFIEDEFSDNDVE